MRHNQQNLLIYLICFVLLVGNTSCLAYQPAIPISNPAPIIAAGELAGLQPGSTYYYLNEVMKAGGEIYTSPNFTHYLIRWAVPNRPGVDGIALINSLETSAEYWKNLRGAVANREDVKTIVKTATDLGWFKVTVKDVGVTDLAKHIAVAVSGIATSGEILLAGVTFYLDEWLDIVRNSEDL